MCQWYVLFWDRPWTPKVYLPASVLVGGTAARPWGWVVISLPPLIVWATEAKRLCAVIPWLVGAISHTLNWDIFEYSVADFALSAWFQDNGVSSYSSGISSYFHIIYAMIAFWRKLKSSPSIISLIYITLGRVMPVPPTHAVVTRKQISPAWNHGRTPSHLVDDGCIYTKPTAYPFSWNPLSKSQT